MRIAAFARRQPGRIATGAFILNSGVGKWSADEQTAVRLHTMASGTYPALARMSPQQFVKVLAAGEIALGTALLVPIVPDALAGAALTVFSASLLRMYLRTPGLRREGSLRPSPQGTALAKDVWMLAIGVGLTIDALTDE
jgi:hypothetical protein